MSRTPGSSNGPIVILGAGGHGRGVLEILRAAAERDGSKCPVLGFLDDRAELFGGNCAGLPILGRIEEAERFDGQGASFLMGVGDPLVRRALVTKLGELPYAGAVHPSAVLYGDVEYGAGAVIAAGVVVAAATRLGAHSLLNLNATVGHDCVLEDFATVGPGANLGGFVTMGEAAFVGLNATVVPGRRIGARARVGPGSVLLEDLKEERIAFGVPARVVDRVRKTE